ncbi:hypothetical protein BDW02DRAFT_580048 [Decorospora gaudefroyi]|uniref:Uncharacterized protein n=1 Tax=Decorospora gaudefroyi TaxID=184978 RepID=A0A6A5KF62_9PLEO|nr:hypothetical protein BDW02DRAFT_580048 [Decorospora gaudefroyi]
MHSVLSDKGGSHAGSPDRANSLIRPRAHRSSVTIGSTLSFVVTNNFSLGVVLAKRPTVSGPISCQTSPSPCPPTTPSTPISTSSFFIESTPYYLLLRRSLFSSLLHFTGGPSCHLPAPGRDSTVARLEPRRASGARQAIVTELVEQPFHSGRPLSPAWSDTPTLASYPTFARSHLYQVEQRDASRPSCLLRAIKLKRTSEEPPILYQYFNLFVNSISLSSAPTHTYCNGTAASQLPLQRAPKHSSDEFYSSTSDNTGLDNTDSRQTSHLDS